MKLEQRGFASQEIGKKETRVSGNQKKGTPCIVFVLQLFSHASHMELN